MSGALLVAGKKLYGEEDYDFETAVQEIGTMLEGRMTVGEILQDQVGDAAAREALLAGVNQGPSIVNFVGHGSNEIWAEPVFLGRRPYPYQWLQASILHQHDVPQRLLPRSLY